ncbi:MAG: beta-galactosidase, partial [Armatimonadetes bacterium]|nr:beta-galactosidase [Armatimonadota bacterium]
QTTHLTIELRERDGSRWIGSVPISTEWQRYGLPAHSLPFWPDCPTAGKRGGPQDRVRLDEVVEVRVGLAKTHGPLADGPKQFWLSSIEVGPVLREATPEALSVPELDAVTPFYKTFTYPKVVQIATPGDTIFGETRFAHKAALRATYPRPWGRVVTGRREKRWVPILEARDDEGGHMYAAALVVQAGGRFAGATWSYWAFSKSGFEAGGEALRRLFGKVVRAQARRLWMVEAGPDQVAYMPDQEPKAGARVINLGAENAHLEVAVRVTRDGAPVAAFRRTVTVEALSEKTVLEPWRSRGPGVYEVLVELRQAGMVIDCLTCPARILADEQHSTGNYVRVENGRFRLGGEFWFPHGTNFWPRYVSGMSTTDYWLHWQNAVHYDPVLVEEDLSIAQRLGITALSIQPPWNERDVPCLWDFLERCRAHGMRVNLFLPIDPRGFDTKYIAAMLEDGRLSRFPSLYAYDITWEPRWGGYAERCRYDAQWREWLNDQYGSLDAAEEIWGFTAPRNEQGEATGPTDDQLRNDGPWRVMVAAYRRFVDDFLSAGYGRSCRFIRARDPYHLISNRAGYGGTGNEWVVGVYQFDPLSGAAHLDFISPEAYGMTPAEGDYRRWGFVDAYCRWAGNGKPVFWSEYGSSIWPGYRPEDYEAQRRIWENVQRLLLFAGADGDAGWWFPGGYRVDERSDYGCIEPWGEPRPSALELRKWASAICNRGDDTRPVCWLEIDRDYCVQGLYGLWVRHLDDYLAAADGEHAVRLRTAADGKTTIDLEIVGVGNVPCRGVGPVKGLNAEVEAVAVEVDGKNYRPATDFLFGEIPVAVPAGRPATVRLIVLNTGEATWACEQSAAGRPGAVRLVDSRTGQVVASIPNDVPRYGRCAIAFGVDQTPAVGQTERLVLRLEAAERCRFGQAIKLVLTGE